LTAVFKAIIDSFITDSLDLEDSEFPLMAVKTLDPRDSVLRVETQ